MAYPSLVLFSHRVVGGLPRAPEQEDSMTPEGSASPFEMRGSVVTTWTWAGFCCLRLLCGSSNY